MRTRECKDCRAEGRTRPPLNIHHVDGKPVPGPRCYNHWKAHQKAQRAAAAAKRVEKAYGLTPELYRAVLDAQGGVCAVCPRRPGKRRLAVDHDHACCEGKTSCGRCVRGLLCWSCNKFLQHLGDDPLMLERGAQYLRNPPAKLVLNTSDPIG